MEQWNNTKYFFYLSSCAVNGRSLIVAQGLSSFEISKLEEKQRREEAIKDLLAKLGLSMTPNKKRQA